LTTHVVFHKDCYDGFGAAWVCFRALLDTPGFEGTVAFHPKLYGDPLPEIADGDRVYMVDFSYPRDVMVELAARTTLTVLDHHKTSQAHCEGLEFCTFDMEKSGAGLAWDYFHVDQPRPPLVDYVEDRDLWRFKLPKSQEVNYWISSYPMDFAYWDQINAALEEDKFKGTEACAAVGAAIKRYSDQKVEEFCTQVQFLKVGDYENIPTVNCGYAFGSTVCHRLLSLYPSAPFSAYYLDRADGEQQWGVRGRSSDDFDVSVVAEKLGGGGHKKAAGFIKGKVSR